MFSDCFVCLQATQYDNPDRYALSTMTVSRPGTSLKDLQFLQSHYYAGVLESVPLNSVLLTVITNRHRDKVNTGSEQNKAQYTRHNNELVTKLTFYFHSFRQYPQYLN